MTRKLLTATVAVLLLAGCASHGVMVSQDKVSTLKKGISTEADAVAALGQPTSVTNYNNVRVLVYSGAHAQARPASFIPFIGPLVGGTDVQSSMVMLHFGPSGILTDVVSTQYRSGGATGFAAGQPIPQTPEIPRRVD